MKLGDIKAEALRLMFVNFDKDINATTIRSLLNDETYASYLVNMNGSINRGLDAIARRGISVTQYRLPSNTSELETAELQDVPDALARLLPLYMKSELYAEEEPSEARLARSLFDNALSEMGDTQSVVAEVYRGY